MQGKTTRNFVDDNKFYVVRSRETYGHLLFDEKIIKT
jgi:hypothetical protein